MNPYEPVPTAGEDLPAWVKRRLERERAARKTAEALLTDKSRTLYQALQQAREAERRLQLALWASGEGIWEWNGQTLRFRVQGLPGLGDTDTPMDVSAEELLAGVHPEDRQQLSLAWRLHVRGARDDIDTAYRILLPEGTRWVRIRGRALSRLPDGAPLVVTGTMKDVTAQREAEHSLQLMAQAFASAMGALLVVDDQWRLVQVNQALRGLLRADQASLEGRDFAEFVTLPTGIDLAGGWHGECPGTRLDHSPLLLEVSVNRVDEHAGQARCYIVALRDIGQRRQAEQALARQALHDSLTTLPNRAALDQHLAARLAAGAADAPFALMFIDLDGFKAVNDSFGHRAGDELLMQVSKRLTGSLTDAFISRWGGDEFVVVLPPCNDDTVLRQAAQVALATLGMPFEVGRHDVMVTPSIGAVMAPEHGTDAQTLIRRADAAMYIAKDRGRNQLVIFQEALDDGVQRRTRLQSLLRTDAERNAFHFVVQPKFDASGRSIGAEMLMRWNAEGLGPVSPAEFIPIAEQIGVIDMMGRQALHAAARTAAEVNAMGAQVRVAVNLSPRQLLRTDLDRIILHACDRHQADPRWLELELTESALVSDVALVERLLVRLRKRGFTLSLDDFGTGYSSLSHLRRLPFHKVKIDRSFVQDLHADPKSRLMLEGIVNLSRNLGLTTVAEGVETTEQFALLRDVGIDEFQGFLFARPQPQAEWFARLRAELASRPGNGG